MKQNAATDMTRTEKIFLGVLAAVVLLVLPMMGAEAMLFGAGAGLVAYTFFFRQRLRSRGWLMVLISVTLAAAVGAVVAAAMSRGN
jgi:hypothetical protein